MKKIIVETYHGSKLYGTHNSGSDTDIKGVYLPSLEECIFLNSNHVITENINPHNRNTFIDTDRQFYSLQKFLEMAYSGDITALEMLNAPDEQLLTTSPEWEFLRENRSKFYTNQIKKYEKFCREQMVNETQVPDKLRLLKSLLQSRENQEDKLKLHLELLKPLSEAKTFRLVNICDPMNPDTPTNIEIAGKYIDLNCTIVNTIPYLDLLIDKFDKKVETKRNKTHKIDYKKLHHVFRIGYELLEIYHSGKLVFPLRQAEYLKKIKQGELLYPHYNLYKDLKVLLEQVQLAASESYFPDNADKKFFQEWLVGVYKENIRNEKIN